MAIEGARPDAIGSGERSLPGKVNYITGNDPRKWHTGIQLFERVRFDSVYPGIDVAYYGTQQELEYDFIVHPGADPKIIKLGFQGAQRLSIDRAGELVLETKGTTMRWHKPVAYQEIHGIRRPVAATYARLSGGIGFRLGSFDRRFDLVIDPQLTLKYSTYLGGKDGDQGNAIAVDGDGNVYVTGVTSGPIVPGSGTFPVAAPLQASPAGSGDVFITKLNAAGTALVYSTYLGGSLLDQGTGIAVDSTGAVYVTGSTTSRNFPIVNGIQRELAGVNGGDNFVAKLNPAGSALVYSTYLGGGGFESNTSSIAADANGNAYVAGATNSQDFPTFRPVQPTNGVTAGFTTCFVTKLDSTGSFVFSTYLGGSGSDAASAIAVDALGVVYITGTTSSPDFPLVNAFQSQSRGSSVFLTKLSGDGSRLVYSTFFDGSENDRGGGLAVDRSGNVYLAGQTASADFPLVNPITGMVPTTAGGGPAFVSKFDASGSALLYSTFLGGAYNGTIAQSIGVDASGNAYVSGLTAALTFQTVYPISSGSGELTGRYFVVKLDPVGGLAYSTRFGSDGATFKAPSAVDRQGNVYLTGHTVDGLSLQNAIQPVFGGGSDAFVAKIAFDDTVPSNPAPTVASILPTSKDVNGPGFTLTVQGAGFISGSIVSWDGVARPTTFVSGNQLTALISSEQLTRVRTYTITVTTPGGGTSNHVTFQVTGNLAPIITLISPLFAAYGGPDLKVTVEGYYFGPSTVAQWNGANRPTTVLSSEELQVTVLASDLTGTGFSNITVYTPPPGGGSAGYIVFQVLPAPSLSTAGVVSGASFAPGTAVAPGSVASLFGGYFTHSYYAGTSVHSVPLPTSFQQVTLIVDGRHAGLYFIGRNQINFQIPWDSVGKTQVTVQAVVASVPSNTITVGITSVAPGIFSLNSQGSGQGAILIAGTNGLIAGKPPDARGWRAVMRGESIEIYSTGLGAVNNQPANGAAASDATSTVMATVTATIGGVPANVTYAGLSPRFVGLYQVNVVVPDSAPVGDQVPVRITTAGVSSNTVTIAVQ